MNIFTLIAPILLLVFANQALARWSSFVVVTPMSQSKEQEIVIPGKKSWEQLHVEAKVSHQGGMCTVKLRPVGYPSKQAWLVITSKQLSKKEQDLRSTIWGQSIQDPNIILKTKLSPYTVWVVNDDFTDAYYELAISKTESQYAYIYIDFPVPVEDGGFYYSIDVGAFCARNSEGSTQ
jgi:hypothetical protein